MTSATTTAAWERTEMGLLVPAGHVAEWRVSQSGVYGPNRNRAYDRPLSVGLFVGAGGMSCGLVSAGFHEVAAVEMDCYAALTYMVNLGAHPINMHFIEPHDRDRMERAISSEHKRRKKEKESPGYVEEWTLRSGSGWISSTEHPGCEHFFLGDVRRLKGQDILDAVGLIPGEIDVVAGGPPCQGLSVANNKRCIEDPRNGLLWEFLRLVEEMRPKTFIIENVPPLLSAAKGALFQALCKKANDAGYNVVANILDAANYGVPQYRRRAFVVGSLPGFGEFRFPMPTTWGIGSRVDGTKWDMLSREEKAQEEESEGVVYDEVNGVFRGEQIGGSEGSTRKAAKAASVTQASFEFEAVS